MLVTVLDSPWVVHHVVLGLEVDVPLVVVVLDFDEVGHDVFVVCHLGVVDGLHQDLEVEDVVVDGTHGHPHGWSVNTILMNVTLSDDVVEALR
jgi:hypothetical protein